MLQLLLVVLLEQYRTDQADDRGFIGEDADDIGAAFDLFVEPLKWVGAVQFAAVRLGEIQIGPADYFKVIGGTGMPYGEVVVASLATFA